MSRKFVAVVRFAAVLAVFGLVATHFASGQGAVTTGTIIGDVSDVTGAAITGAKAVAENRATGLRREEAADANGHFVFSQLPAGRYEIEVKATGFKASVVRDFQLNVDASPTVKFKLDLGRVDQVVEVSDEQITVDTSKTEVSGVIQEAQVRELPLNQRSFTALVTQQPGLVSMTNTSNAQGQTPTSTAYSQGSQISANGMGSQSLAYLIDGVNVNNSGFGAPGTAAGGDIPGVEGIQEFKVLSQDYGAEYGGSAGAVVSFATRSGTNNLHGSAYEFIRNNKMDAREFFNSVGAQNPYKRNQFGATLGGPIKKDKTFFFVNYEGLRSRLTTSATEIMPDECARNGGVGGNTNGCAGNPSQPFQVLGPDHVTPVAISAGVKAILDAYGPVNGSRDILTAQGASSGIASLVFPDYHPVNQHYGLVRFDQVLSKNDTLMARYSITNASGYSAFFVPTYQFNNYSRLQGAVLKWTRTISNNLVNTASLSVNRSLTTSSVNPTVRIDPAAYTGNPARQLLGSINVGGGGVTSGALSSIGIDTWGPFRGAHNTLPFNDDMIYTRGAHTVKFGFQFVPHQWNWDKGDLASGDYVFLSLNDLLAANPEILFILQDGAQPHWKFTSKQIGWYLQDGWRIKPNLTLTLGIRHAFQAPVLAESHSPSRFGIVTSRDSITNSVGEPFGNHTKLDFSPRVGIAYDPFNNGKTVIRAGFGLFFDSVSLEQTAGHITYDGPQPLLNAAFGAPVGGPQIPFPSCPVLPGGQSTCTAPSPFLGILTAVLGKVRPPTSLQWNWQIERDLPAGFKISGTYVGSHSYNILRGFEGNTSLPCSITNGQPYFGVSPFGKGACGLTAPLVSTVAIELYSVAYDGKANYHSGTVNLTRRFKSGISFGAAYTFAKGMSDTDSIDLNASMTGNATHSEWPTNQRTDWSESQYSIRHRFTMNGILELPFGKGKPFAGGATGVKQAFLGGWSFSPLMEIRDGIPFSVLAGVPITQVGDAVALPDRPDQISKNVVKGGITHYFDPKAYALQTVGYLGNSTRDSARGPNYTAVDLSLAKKFRFSERMNLEFRAEVFNIINHPNFDLPFNQVYTTTPAFINGSPNPSADITSCNMTPSAVALNWSCNPLAGAITRTVATPRQLQFALKLTF